MKLVSIPEPEHEGSRRINFIFLNLVYEELKVKKSPRIGSTFVAEYFLRFFVRVSNLFEFFSKANTVPR